MQFVQIGNSKSDVLRQICGVPRGSILGPLFFILYINDLPACSNDLEFIVFADDTSIFFEHNDLDVLTSHLNDQLKNVSTWLKANKLSINVKKTKLMIFRPRQKTLPNTRQIILENNVLEQVAKTKFLGVYIDQHLEWKTHCDSLLRLKFLNLSDYFIKPNTTCPQILFLHYTMHLFIPILLTAI